MYKVAALLILLATGTVGAQDASLTSDELFRMSNSLETIRTSVLRDTTKIDLCALDQFWRGANVASEAAPMSRYRSRSECQSSAVDMRANGVFLTDLRIFGNDSVVVYGRTVRENNQLVIFESYKFGNSSSRASGLMYRVHAVSRTN
jgi:hypothetical protein